MSLTRVTTCMAQEPVDARWRSEQLSRLRPTGPPLDSDHRVHSRPAGPVPEGLKTGHTLHALSACPKTSQAVPGICRHFSSGTFGDVGDVLGRFPANHLFRLGGGLVAGELRNVGRGGRRWRTRGRRVERLRGAGRSAGTASSSGCWRGPSILGRGGCRPRRSSGCRRCDAGHGSAACAVPRVGAPGRIGASAPRRRGSRRLPGETRSSSLVKLSRAPRRARADATSGAIGTARVRPDFGVVRCPLT